MLLELTLLTIALMSGSVVIPDLEVLGPKKLVGVDFQNRTDSAYFRKYVARRNLQDRLRTHWNTDQRDAARLRRIVASEFDGPLDLVLDDASHGYAATRASFESETLLVTLPCSENTESRAMAIAPTTIGRIAMTMMSSMRVKPASSPSRRERVARRAIATGCVRVVRPVMMLTHPMDTVVQPAVGARRTGESTTYESSEIAIAKSPRSLQ